MTRGDNGRPEVPVMPSELDRWLRPSGQHMTRSDSRFRLYIALWFSRSVLKRAQLRLMTWRQISLFCRLLALVLGVLLQSLRLHSYNRSWRLGKRFQKALFISAAVVKRCERSAAQALRRNSAIPSLKSGRIVRGSITFSPTIVPVRVRMVPITQQLIQQHANGKQIGRNIPPSEVGVRCLVRRCA